jgi:hypothetical protein
MKIQSLRNFCYVCACACALAATTPFNSIAAPQGSSVKIAPPSGGAVTGVRPSAPANQGFTGLLTVMSLARSPNRLPARLQIRTEFGYTREVGVDGGTTITRAGLPALITDAKIGDTVGVVFSGASDHAMRLAFTPRPVQLTPEQIAKQKADADAKTLKSLQNTAGTNAVSQYRLGMKYLKGDGVPKDAAQGKSLLEKSAAQGNEQAKAELVKLNSTASASDTSSTQTNAPTK